MDKKRKKIWAVIRIEDKGVEYRDIRLIDIME